MASGETRMVTLLSDFGLRDGYVAAMKGVIAGLAPGASMIDAAHDIPPQDIQAAAWALRQYWSLYPPGTIHVAVVDPGVGSPRRGLCIEVDDRLIIAPDNGLAGLAVEQARSARFHAIKPAAHRPGVLSATFHGRDVFAHVAGTLLSGRALLQDLCETVDSIVMPSWARVRQTPVTIEGEVIHIDHFGNLVTNIHHTLMGSADWMIASVRVGHRMALRVRRTYSDVPMGTPVAVFGSTENLEIAVNGRSAQELIGCGRGTVVIVEKGLLARDQAAV